MTVREGGSRTVREAGGQTVREAPGAPATVREGPTSPLPRVGADLPEQQVRGWLPGSLAADYRIVEALPARGAEADLYVVSPSGGPDAEEPARLIAKVYRQGYDPGESVLQRIRDADPDHVVQVHAFGEDAGCWWELMEFIEHGSLADLIEQEGPRLPDALVMDILRELNNALASLHGLNMEHKDLKPDNVLVRSRSPLQLVLIDFGVTSALKATEHFTKMAGTRQYAPPEFDAGVVTRTTYDYWSLGMILVEMLAGEHPFAGDNVRDQTISHRLATDNTEFLVEGVADPSWRKLCRGLLRRAPSDRWDTEAVSKWIADPDDPDLFVAEEAAPESRADREAPAIDFDGAAYSTPVDLGLALSKDWDKAESFWTRRFGDVRTWLADGLGRQEVGDAIAAIDDSPVSLDAQVFNFIYTLAPNAPLRFRNEDIAVERIVALGERAMVDADREAAEALLVLYRERIMMLAALLPNQEALADVSGRWDETVQRYEGLRQHLAARSVAVPELDDDQLVMLLAASMPDSPLAAPLRSLAWSACTEDAWRCDWFRERFGHPEEMSVAAMVMLPFVHAAAQRRGRAARARPRRTLVGGLVAGALFGILVAWADPASLSSASVYDPPDVDDANVWGGVFLLFPLILAVRFTIAWFRGDEGKGWERVLFGSDDETLAGAVDFSWPALLASGTAAEDGR